MRLILVAILGIIALPGSAAAKNWFDESCSIRLSTDQANPPFLLTSKEGRVGCRVQSWPVDTDIATMHCDDGSFPKMALMPSGQVLFGNHHLFPGEHCGGSVALSQPEAQSGPPLTIDSGLVEAGEICFSGKRRGGGEVTGEEREAACEESVAGVSKLMQAGYCPSADNSTWVRCPETPRSTPQPIPVAPPDRQVDRWADASHACLAGEDRDGTKLSEEAADAACVQSAAILEDLEKAGYCRAPNGLGWVHCE